MAMTKEKSGRDGEPVPAEEPEAADREIRPEKPGKPEISDLTERDGTDETDVTDATDAASPAGDEAGPGEDKLKQELDASLAEAEILRKRLAEAQRRETQRSRTEAVRRYFEDEGLPEGLKMIQVRSFDYDMFGSALEGDLYLMKESILKATLEESP
ncbi:MAG: hypothetical protein J6Q17_03395, partial [Clostridia bacterium]|nr:hypothetical protein [Clostridia bacterium]